MINSVSPNKTVLLTGAGGPASAGMIAALSVMTVAIAAQGFMGAALTHGMDHMMF